MQGVQYKKLFLTKGSEAYELFLQDTPESRKKLDLHIKSLYDKEKELVARYENSK